ncbi:hypothetical protein PV783_24655 [Chitinophaga sp. CC14]|uniref:hypothetical protein n=1 Tax=Chitinophaga sp. CC14 TaxID=3029199 RepID=UPI003B7CAF32
MNSYTPSVHTIAITSIILGLILFFLSGKRHYDRMVNIKAKRPLPFWQFLIVRVIEWFWTWLYRLLIVLGLFFLLIDWYISPSG